MCTVKTKYKTEERKCWAELGEEGESKTYSKERKVRNKYKIGRVRDEVKREGGRVHKEMK